MFKNIRLKLLALFTVLVSFTLAGCSEEETERTQPAGIPSIIEEAIIEKTNGIDIKDITINPFLGEGAKEGDKIALIHLKWGVSNSAETTRKMLEMYGARVIFALESEPEIKEAVIFWEVPYHAKGMNSAKFNYERRGDGFYTNGEWYAPVLR